MVDAFSMAASVAVGLILGVNLDKWLKTSPLFTLIFIFLGIGSSIYTVLKGPKK